MRDISDKEDYKNLFLDVYNHAINCDRLVTFTNSRTLDIKAFLSVSLVQLQEEQIYHLEGIIIDSSLCGKDFSYQILRQDIKDCKADILAFHTQSKLMENLGKKLSISDIKLVESVVDLINTSNTVFLEEGPIDKGRYGATSLYGNVEKFSEIAIKRKDFNFREGDAIVYAGRVIK